MKKITKILAGLTLAAAFGTAANAAVINVGGVTWDPDTSNTLADNDFTARYEFNQFFTTSGNQVADTDNATVNYANAKDPSTVGFSDVLQGVGEVDKFNGVNYGDTSSLIGGAFCNTCELTFVFGGFQVNGPNAFSNGWLRLYVDSTPDFSVTQMSASSASDGELFLELRAIYNEFVGTNFKGGFLESIFEVTGGLAAGNFDTNTQALAADLLSTASSTFIGNSFIATSTGQISGNSIPEPSTVLLMGLAILGFAASRHRKVKN